MRMRRMPQVLALLLQKYWLTGTKVQMLTPEELPHAVCERMLTYADYADVC